jgi:hypothetical protein
MKETCIRGAEANHVGRKKILMNTPFSVRLLWWYFLPDVYW